jgi:probable rRNA maturation factor
MDIAVKTQRTRIPLKQRDVERSAVLMLKKAGVRSAELSIVFLDAPAMRLLNRKHLGHDSVTDVVTFDLRDSTGAPVHQCTSAPVSAGVVRAQNKSVSGARVLWCSGALLEGEIYICPAEARRNAKRYGEPVKRELLRYLAHGILHLLGCDDSTASERERMRALEDELLNA